jgi:predicted glycogen debranching enzyme
MSSRCPDTAEWLEADGLGGFASGTAGLVRTRRYHALLLPAATPPTGRTVLVNGLEVIVSTPGGEVALSSQRYLPDVLHPDGASRIDAFEPDPWPRWTFALPDGRRVVQEIVAVHGTPIVLVAWRLEGGGAATLSVRPLLSGRDSHALHHENPAFRFDPESAVPGRLVFRPYPGLPAVTLLGDADYRHEPQWYRNFLYTAERARGLDHVEDLASPGVLRFDLGRGEAALLLAAGDADRSLLQAGETPVAAWRRLREAERRRRAVFPDRLQRAADAYLVRRGAGRTIVAGYPWFTDWGRDTFIALRGLCLATGRLDVARSILREWAGAVSRGMLPNRFPDPGEAPQFNAVDASLWFVVAVHDTLRAATAAGDTVPEEEARRLGAVIGAILDGYAAGTRYGIRPDQDGLLAAGEPGVQLTWMDARVGDWVVTPRIGKPVEVQALWLNALRIGAGFDTRWRTLLERGLASFRRRFLDRERGRLYDVVDVDHQPGRVDPSFRPNQILAVGGLPFPILEGEAARRVVDAVESRLMTPLGPRSLAPGEPGYAPRYEGGVAQRDGAYHQGTVWPWLVGPFVEAWVRVRGGTAAARREARYRFLEPLLLHLDEAGIGHLPEIADADPPHTPRGCPFQAWSVGEALRLDRIVLAETARRGRRPARRNAAPTTTGTARRDGRTAEARADDDARH